MKPISFFVRCVFLVTFSWRVLGQEDYSRLFNETPDTDGWDYSCPQMVSVVNRLRHMGKDKVISVLTNFVQRVHQRGDGGRVHMLCRLLFVNTNGWTLAALGAPEPPVHLDIVTNEFPLFPIAMSDGVPFVLVAGFRLGGFPEPPDQCVELCRNLPLITSDLPTNGFMLAAEKLIQSDAFHRLYEPSIITDSTPLMILNQATNRFFAAEPFAPNLFRLKQADGETIAEIRLLSATNLVMDSANFLFMYGGDQPPTRTLTNATIEFAGKDGKTITIKAAQVEALEEKK